MGSLLRDSAVLQHHDDIGMLNGRESMRGDQRRFAGAFAPDIIDDSGFRPGIHSGQGIVQN